MTIDLTAQIHQYLTSAPSSLFAQQTVEMLEHWEGDANLLWRVHAENEDAVVKLFLDAGQARSRRQFDGHQIFAPRGLAPQPLWADRYPHGLSRQLIVYRWSDGKTVSADLPSEFEAWAAAIGTLHSTPAMEVRRFSPHPVNLDYYWRIEQGSIAQIQQWLAPSGLDLALFFQSLATATAQLVERSLPLWAGTMPTPVHGDLSRQHTLIERGRVLLLDWEMFGLGDPALDVARLWQREAQSLDDNQVEQWLDRYLAVVDQPTLGARIGIFQRLLEMHSVLYLLSGLQQHTAGVLDEELRAALAFMQDTVGTVLDRAASALDLPPLPDTRRVVESFFSWLLTATPNTR